VQTTKGRYAWPNYLIATGLTTVGDLHITDTSTNGLSPDPNGDFIPNEHILTIVQVGYIPPASPTVVNATYNSGAITNPANIKGLVKSTPSGTVPIWCDPNGNNCFVEPPLVSAKPGVYVWCVKALDTATGLNSESCVMDTVTILPTVAVNNLTLMNTVITNPKNISSLITSITPGSIPQWCDPNGNNCTTIAPLVPAQPGKYVWCVKAIDTASKLTSATCKLDTLTILNPYEVLEIKKQATSVKVNLDGSIIVDFVIKAQNKTTGTIDSLSIKDDLTNTFKASNGFKVAQVAVTGTLFKNAGYDGVGNIELVTKYSSLAALKEDSIQLKVLVQSPNLIGDFENTATASALTPYGRVNLVSNDPILNPNNLLKRVPTPFVLPKIEVIIPEGFSPNNDGFDDTWNITRKMGTTIIVKVFNRWGNEIYKNNDYQNNWRGKGVSNFMGEDVPEGTYYYIVEVVDSIGNKKQFTGPLTIIR
jgi:gliding motility-associated-like protein